VGQALSDWRLCARYIYPTFEGFYMVKIDPYVGTFWLFAEPSFDELVWSGYHFPDVEMDAWLELGVIEPD